MNTAPHKPNEWFTQEAKVVGNHFIIKVNGKQTVDFVDEGNTFTKGHFALQGMREAGDDECPPRMRMTGGRA